MTNLYYQGEVLYAAVGFLVGLNVYSIFRLYYWRRAKFHYSVALLISVVYIVGVLFVNEDWAESFILLAVLFSVFYAWRRIRIIEAFEVRTGMRVRQTKYSVKELLANDDLVQPYLDQLTGGEETQLQKNVRKEHESTEE